MKSVTSIFILLIIAARISFCQVDESPKRETFSSINTQYNVIDFIPHNDTLVTLKKRFFQNLEIDAIFNSSGNKKWHRVYKLPQLGVSVNYFDFGNKDLLGNGVGLYPFMILKLASKRKLELNFRYGGGLVYISKIYESDQYPTNVAISTPINVLIDFRLYFSYRINSKIQLQSSLLATHISNGAIKKPNYGLNSLGLGIGFIYNLNKIESMHSNPISEIVYKPCFQVAISGAIKEVGNAGGPKYYPISLQTSYIKPISSMVELGGNVDVMYDKSVRFYLQEKGLNYKSTSDDFSMGLSARLKLPMDKFSIFADLGIYLYKPNPRFPIVYQRIGIDYSILKRITIMMALKTHYTVADHLGLGLALKI